MLHKKLRSQKYLIYPIAWTVMSLNFLILFHSQVYAQPTIELVTDPAPEQKTIHINSGLKEIWIEARLRIRNVKLTWNIDGPGNFKASEGGGGGIYTVPAQIDDTSAKVTISATATDTGGKTAKSSVSFELIAPLPTPKPEPTPTPAPVTIRQVLLQHERFYLVPGETVILIVKFGDPLDQKLKVKCAAVKGKADCTAVKKETIEIRYTAPDQPGKEMLEIQVIDSERDETEYALIKIEILDL